MPLYESSALILRSVRLGEADKIVTLFTRRYGKLKAVAKGALRPKSRFGGRLEPFAQVNAILFGKEKAELYRVNSMDIIDPFFYLRDDLERLGRAYVSAELVDACQKERDANYEGFEMLVAFWRSISMESKPDRLDLLLRLFELKCMAQIGFGPALTRCVSCGRAPSGLEAGFDPLKGGVVCSDCLPLAPAAFRTTMGAIKLMTRGMSMPVEMLGRLSAAAGPLAEVERMTNSLVETHVRRKIRSEKFLRPPGAR